MSGLVEPIAVALLLVFLVGVVGFTAITFAVAFARAPRPPALPIAFFKELLAAFLLLPAWPLWALLGARYEAGRPGAAAAVGRSRRPIILLHGYLMNRTNWLWLGRSLARRGLGPLHGFTWGSHHGVARAAGELARFVDRVLAREGAERVDIVAHSMGGLVARHFVEHLGGARRVRRLVTIATPHRGTGLARFAPRAARADLAAGCGPTQPGDGVLYTSIWSRCDNLVVPPDSARLAPDDAAGSRWDDVVFDDLGHMGVLLSPRVLDVVATRLAA